MYRIKQLPEDFIVEEIPAFVIQPSGDYSYYLLEKQGIDTELAIQRVSDFSGMKRKYFGIAGYKDRHARTRQYFSLRGKMKDHGFSDFNVRFIGYGKKPISLGDLAGNRFIIIVRDIKNGPSKISEIINYFDEQRFGRHNLEIGMSILKKDFRIASSLIDLPDAKRHLEISPNDYINSIKKVPFRILCLYIHAAQSYLWNEVASRYVILKSKKKWSSDYMHGKFVFSDTKIETIRIPLISFDTDLDGEIKKIYEEILERNNLSLRDFVIRQLPDITPMGGERELVAEVKNLQISKPENDELNKGKKKVRLSFELGKGSYATIVVRNMFRDKSIL